MYVHMSLMVKTQIEVNVVTINKIKIAKKKL